jgi:hypothetical protein
MPRESAGGQAQIPANHERPSLENVRQCASEGALPTLPTWSDDPSQAFLRTREHR